MNQNQFQQCNQRSNSNQPPIIQNPIQKMQISGFTSSEIDFTSSQVSQLSNYHFDTNTNFSPKDTVINNTISDGTDSLKDFDQSAHINANHLVKKLYMKDLQVNRQKQQALKTSNKQNNIPNHLNKQTYGHSRKIIIHKNTSTVSPYRNSQPADQSFTTNKIVQLQEQMICLRKEIGLKESNWIKEKSILINKMQMASLEVAQMKQRNNNLIQINQTLTQALGQSAKNEAIGEYERKIEEMSKDLTQKNKKIQNLQDTLSRIERDKTEQIMRQKQDKQKIDYLSKTLEEYKLLVKESNQRKFESDSKMVLLSENIKTIKQKLNDLPIKNEYLRPIFSLLTTLIDPVYSNQQLRGAHENYGTRVNDDRSYINDYQRDQRQSLNFSQIKKPFQALKQTLNQNCFKVNKQQESSFINQLNDTSAHYQNYELYTKSNHDIHNYYEINPNEANRRKNTFHNILLNHQQVKRIDTSQDNYQDYQPNTNQTPYHHNHTYIDNNTCYLQAQAQQQVYLCEVCHRVYPHLQFLNHMKACQEYEVLLQQKKQIESKLISINEVEYQSRKSHMNSLNSSAIVLNKSRSKTKIAKHNQRPLTGRHSNMQQHRQAREGRASQHERGDYTGRKENLTERYHQKDDNDDSSQLELSELMNISGISTKPSHLNLHREARDKYSSKPLISPNKFYPSQMHNQNYVTHQQNADDSGFLNSDPIQYKASPQVKYASQMAKRNVGKESMQEEIRKIVDAINEGKSSKSRPDSFSSKPSGHNQPRIESHNQPRIESHRKQFIAKGNRHKPQFY